MSELTDRAEAILARRKKAVDAMREQVNLRDPFDMSPSSEYNAASAERSAALTEFIEFVNDELPALVEEAKAAEANAAEQVFSDLYKMAGQMIDAAHVEANYPIYAVPVSHIKGVQAAHRKISKVQEIPKEGSAWGSYRKIPVVVKAIRYTGDNLDDIIEFMGGARAAQVRQGYLPGPGRGMVPGLIITTLNGPVNVPEGEWIIEGVKGEFYPCRDDIMRETYNCVGLR